LEKRPEQLVMENEYDSDLRKKKNVRKDLNVGGLFTTPWFEGVNM
jgi:hypothetical protein